MEEEKKQLPQEEDPYDVDVLLLYGPETPADTVARTVAQLVAEGKTVTAQGAIPRKLRFRETRTLGKEACSC